MPEAEQVRVSATQLQDWRDELVPRIRRVCPDLSDEAFSGLIDGMMRVLASDVERMRKNPRS
jgi:hypothetical protein